MPNVEEKISKNNCKLNEIALRVLKKYGNEPIETVENLVNLLIAEKYPINNFDSLISDKNPKWNTNNLQSNEIINENDIWIFGYGSLIWKADFPYILQEKGYIENYVRKFYQNSTDHRGTLEKPGRVVTLLPTNDIKSKVWGIAYRISYKIKENVLQHLDFREKNGYQKIFVNFYPYKDSMNTKSIKNVITYIATKDNKSFAGDLSDINYITNQIFNAYGPSGSNKDYVFKLANAMRELFPKERDEHLFDIEAKLKDLEQGELQKLNSDLIRIIENALKNNTFIDDIVIALNNKF